MPQGRPSIYTPELASEIIRRMCEGESLRVICRDDDMPARSTVCLWIAENREGFSDQYAIGQMAQAHYWVEEIIEIADDGRNDTYETEEGERVNTEVIQRSRLRVDTRKWYASKLLPKLFGERLALTGGDGGPIETREVPDAELLVRAERLRNRVAGVLPPSTNGNGKH